MISVAEALNIINSQEVNPNHTMLSLEQALGYVLAEDMSAPFPLPSFRQSAMDGYAVKGTHSTYRVVGETQAGRSLKKSLKEGECLRVFTGAAVPENATAVVMQEKVQLTGEKIALEEGVALSGGQNIRPVGEQVDKGEVVLRQGHHINAATIGFLASFGIRNVKVFKKPRISLVLTGNELVTEDRPLKYGEIYESNASALVAAACEKGFDIDNVEFVRDEFEHTREVIGDALVRSDVVLISGGISVGDYDFVKQALESHGVEELFYKVLQKPGKPLFFGRKGDVFVFGLPGNPAAALTSFYVYAYPLLHRIQGITGRLSEEHAVLLNDFFKKGKATVFLKAVTKDGKVQILGKQASSMLQSFSEANALAVAEGENVTYKKGDTILVYRLY